MFRSDKNSGPCVVLVLRDWRLGMEMEDRIGGSASW